MPPRENHGLAGAAGRAALYPARAAARAWRDQLESAADDMLSAPEIMRVIDRALAGPLPEELAQSLVRHRVLERVVGELAATGELERLLQSALASPRTLALTDHVLASAETQHALRQVASSPELRAALTQQTTGLLGEVSGSLTATAARLDDRVEAPFHHRARAAATPYAGIATRALALVTDALVTIGIYGVIVAVVALLGALAGGIHTQWLVDTLLAVGWPVVAGAYFVLFWSSAGQTPGMRLLRLRVRAPAGAPPSLARSVVRLAGLAVSILALFLGFVPVLFDERRRGLADFLAGTTVAYDREEAFTRTG
jgi:uncharacterized RDD family membrane protein YckC